jgi:tRNA1(Val) A37 N6-methylase TrmN6
MSNYIIIENNYYYLGDMHQILDSREFRDKKFECILTGLPDMEEIRNLSESKNRYLGWIKQVLVLLFSRIEDDGYVIFLQTDRKKDGEWIQKSNYISSIAQELGFKCMWDKIMLYREEGKIHLQRPSYGHILCFSKRGTPGTAFADVIDGFKRLYKNGTPIKPLVYICKYFLKPKGINHILDPFAGMGTVSLVCKRFNISSTNIEIDKNRYDEMIKRLSSINKLKLNNNLNIEIINRERKGKNVSNGIVESTRIVNIISRNPKRVRSEKSGNNQNPNPNENQLIRLNNQLIRLNTQENQLIRLNNQLISLNNEGLHNMQENREKLVVNPIEYINNLARNGNRLTVLSQNEVANYLENKLFTTFDEFYSSFSISNNKSLNKNEFSEKFLILYVPPISLAEIFRKMEIERNTDDIRYIERERIIDKFYNDFYINSRETNKRLFDSYLNINIPGDYWKYVDIYNSKNKILSVQKRDASKRIIRNIFYKELLEYTKISTTKSKKKSFLETWKDLFAKLELDGAYFAPSVIRSYLKGAPMSYFFQQYQPKASILNPYSIFYLLDYYFPTICPGTDVLYTPVLSWGSYALAYCNTENWNKYIAVDVMPTVVLKTKKLINLYNKKQKEFEIHQIPSEQFVDPKYISNVDLVLVCPPYYKMEIYRNAFYNNKSNNLNFQSIKKHDRYDRWIEDYWNATVKNCYKFLKDNGIFAFIIGNYKDYKTGKSYDLKNDLQRIFKDPKRWIYVDSMKMQKRKESIRGENQRNESTTGENRFEEMFIYRKINKLC